MTREMKIEIIMADNCTRKEAERYLDNATTVYDDFEERFDQYMKEWQEDEEGIEYYRDLMINKKSTGCGSSWVEYNGKWYFIQYCL